MKKPFVKKAILTTAALTSATLLTFGPDAASAKTVSHSTPALQETITNEDLNTFFDLLNQCIYEEDGVYYFDSEKAVELGMTQEEAQIIAKLWESTSEFFDIVSQCVYVDVEDGSYKFDTEKAVELGFTEKEALALDQFFAAVSLKIHILQASIVSEDGAYSFDKDAALEAGATPEQADFYEKLFGALSQEQLAAIYQMLHPQA
ncbi:hypothetical protein [Bacillus halotolerans]|uniref:hypothetical protein n=1 Tax=Bacillus halotolerans TaxID=260554 RepID=UPI00075145E7|nr:hypothetical protein [Bacillus halotolerans]KUP37215.1 hypothetical protein AU384_07420 [Bacillus halotolerans]